MSNEQTEQLQSESLEEAAGFSGAYGDAPTETPAAEPEVKAEPPKAEEQPVVEETQDPIKVFAERLDKIQRGHDVLAGHIGSLSQGQRAIQQMLSESRQIAKEGVDSPTQAEAEKAAQDPEEFKALKEEYPQWGAAIEKAMEARLAKVQTFRPEQIESIVQQRVEQKLAEQARQAVDVHLDAVAGGNWQETVRGQTFQEWMAKQSEQIKALAESPHMRDAATMLRLFRADQSKPAKQVPTAPSPHQKRFEAAITPKAQSGAPQRNAAETELDAFKATY